MTDELSLGQVRYGCRLSRGRGGAVSFSEERKSAASPESGNAASPGKAKELKDAGVDAGQLGSAGGGAAGDEEDAAAAATEAAAADEKKREEAAAAAAKATAAAAAEAAAADGMKREEAVAAAKVAAEVAAADPDSLAGAVGADSAEEKKEGDGATEKKGEEVAVAADSAEVKKEGDGATEENKEDEVAVVDEKQKKEGDGATEGVLDDPAAAAAAAAAAAGGDADVKNEVEGAVTSAKRAAQAAPSTVADFIFRAGADAEKALKKYIASFGSGNQESELGTKPPCRSYRHLRLLTSTVLEYERRIRGIQQKHEVVAVKSDLAPIKKAFKELAVLAEAAAMRCEGAIKEAKKRKDRSITL